MTDSHQDELARWRAEGLITIDQEEALRAARGKPLEAGSERRKPEAFAYWGAILFLIGGLVMAFNDLALDPFGERSAGRVAVIALLVAVALGAAAYVLNGDGSHLPASRAAAFVAAMAVVGLAIALAVFLIDTVDFGEASVLVFGLVVSAIALALWQWRPSAPLAVTTGIAHAIFIVGVLVVVDDGAFGLAPQTTGTAVLGGLLFGGAGIAWLRLGHVGTLRPRNTAYVVGALLTYTGTQLLVTVSSGWLLLTMAIGASLVAVGAAASRTLLIALGTFGIVSGFFGILGEVFEDSIGVGVASLALGSAGLLAAISYRQRSKGSEGVPAGEEAEGT